MAIRTQTLEPAFSWGAVIAGAFTAVAVMILLVEIGAGAGLLTASAMEGTSSTIRGAAIGTALWMWFVHAMSFLAGGYVAGRLGAEWPEATQEESNFRDGMHGFVVWAVAAVLSTGAAVALGIMSMTAITTAGIQGAANAASSGRLEYAVDTLLRPASNAQAGAPADAQAQRAEVGRILTYGLAKGELSPADKDYVAGVIASRAGVTPDEARSRIDQAQQTAKEAARSTARATAFVSIWMLIGMLFGALGAIFGGIWGGDDRVGRASARLPFGYRRN